MAIPAPAAPADGIEERLVDNAQAWLATHPFLSTFTSKERDENTLLQPPEAPPRPIIIIVAKDEGRAHKLMPIRNVRLAFMVRANAKTPGGSAESFSAIGGALEILLDKTNLVQALSGPKIGVMLATRQAGIQFRENGLVREGTVIIDCKCVAAELTTGGTGVVA